MSYFSRFTVIFSFICAFTKHIKRANCCLAIFHPNTATKVPSFWQLHQKGKMSLPQFCPMPTSLYDKYKWLYKLTSFDNSLLSLAWIVWEASSISCFLLISITSCSSASRSLKNSNTHIHFTSLFIMDIFKVLETEQRH